MEKQTRRNRPGFARGIFSTWFAFQGSAAAAGAGTRDRMGSQVMPGSVSTKPCRATRGNWGPPCDKSLMLTAGGARAAGLRGSEAGVGLALQHHLWGSWQQHPNPICEAATRRLTSHASSYSLEVFYYEYKNFGQKILELIPHQSLADELI